MPTPIINYLLGSTNQYILDDVKNSVAAYSLDKLKKNATSPCALSFSDASPNMVVPFANNTFDKIAVENYIKSRNGGVLTGISVYIQQLTDQSGNGNHAIQTTASKQPRVMNNGVWDVDVNGKLSPYFDGVEDCMKITDNLSLQLTTNLTINSVVKVVTGAIGGYVLSRNELGAADIQYGMLWSTNKRYDIYLNGATRENSGNNSALENSSKIITSKYDKVTAEVFVNGVTDGSTAFTETLTNRSNMFVGARSSSADGSTQATFFKGNIYEIILFSKTLSTSDQTKIKRSQSKRYKIAVS